MDYYVKMSKIIRLEGRRTLNRGCQNISQVNEDMGNR